MRVRRADRSALLVRPCGLHAHRLAGSFLTMPVWTASPPIVTKHARAVSKQAGTQAAGESRENGTRVAPQGAGVRQRRRYAVLPGGRGDPAQASRPLPRPGGEPVRRGADGRGGLRLRLLAALPRAPADGDREERGPGRRGERGAARAQPPAAAAPLPHPGPAVRRRPGPRQAADDGQRRRADLLRRRRRRVRPVPQLIRRRGRLPAIGLGRRSSRSTAPSRQAPATM